MSPHDYANVHSVSVSVCQCASLSVSPILSVFSARDSRLFGLQSEGSFTGFCWRTSGVQFLLLYYQLIHRLSRLSSDFLSRSHTMTSFHFNSVQTVNIVNLHLESIGPIPEGAVMMFHMGGSGPDVPPSGTVSRFPPAPAPSRGGYPYPPSNSNPDDDDENHDGGHFPPMQTPDIHGDGDMNEYEQDQEDSKSQSKKKSKKKKDKKHKKHKKDKKSKLNKKKMLMVKEKPGKDHDIVASQKLYEPDPNDEPDRCLCDKQTESFVDQTFDQVFHDHVKSLDVNDDEHEDDECGFVFMHQNLVNLGIGDASISQTSPSQSSWSPPVLPILTQSSPTLSPRPSLRRLKVFSLEKDDDEDVESFTIADAPADGH